MLFEKIPFFVLSAASCIITVLAQREAMASLKNVPVDYRLENVPVACAGYLLKMIWPAHLAIFYPLNSLSRLDVAAAVAALALISWLAWRVRRSCPYWLVGWLWFLGTLRAGHWPGAGRRSVNGRPLHLFSVHRNFSGGGDGHSQRHGTVSGFKTHCRGGPGLVLAACLWLTHNQLNL